LSNYSSGRSLEYELKALFEGAGWDVLRGSSSKGNVFGVKCDLIATKKTGKIKRTAYMRAYNILGWMVTIQAKRIKKRK